MSRARFLVARVAELALLFAALATPAAGQQADTVLVWGHGLFHVDLETRKVSTWLDASHEVQRVCWVADPAGGAGTVFVAEHDALLRLDASSGRPVSVQAPGDLSLPAVQARAIVDLADGGGVLASVQIDRAADGTGSGRPFRALQPATPALSDGTRAPMPLPPAADAWLDAVPERLAGNAALQRLQGTPLAYVSLSPAAGLGPRVWSDAAEAPRPQPEPADEKWFVQGFAMATSAPRCYALLAAPFSATRLMACDFSAGLAGATWTTLKTKLPLADPQIMSLYLCSADGRHLLVGNGYRLDVLDGSSGKRYATVALQGIARDSDAVVDATLIDLPHDAARHPAQDAAAVPACLRDDAWIGGLLRVVDPHGLWSGAMQVAAWDLDSGAILKLIDVPAGVTQITTLPLAPSTGAPAAAAAPAPPPTSTPAATPPGPPASGP